MTEIHNRAMQSDFLSVSIRSQYKTSLLLQLTVATICRRDSEFITLIDAGRCNKPG